MSKHVLLNEVYFAKTWNKRCQWCNQFYDTEEGCPVTTREKMEDWTVSLIILAAIVFPVIWLIAGAIQ